MGCRCSERLKVNTRSGESVSHIRWSGEMDKERFFCLLKKIKRELKRMIRLRRATGEREYCTGKNKVMSR